MRIPNSTIQMPETHNFNCSFVFNSNKKRARVSVAGGVGGPALARDDG